MIPNYLREFNEKFYYFEYRHSTHTIWADFLELSVCGLAWGSLEDKRKNILEKYKSDEQKKFWELFEELIKIYAGSDDVIDPLGDYYQVLASDSSKSHFGQFFTPFSVSDFMADVAIIKNETGLKIQDPACGSSRLLLSINHKYPNNFVFGCDLDRICVLMSCINLCMQGAKGEVCWKDSLNPFDHREIYAINLYLVNGQNLPSIILLSDHTQSFIYRSDMNQIDKHRAEKIDKSPKKIQMSIF